MVKIIFLIQTGKETDQNKTKAKTKVTNLGWIGDKQEKHDFKIDYWNYICRMFDILNMQSAK